MNSLGSEPSGVSPHLCWGVLGPLPVLFSTKVSGDVHCWGARVTMTPPAPLQALWELVGVKAGVAVPAWGRGCGIHSGKAAESGEK